MACFVLIMSQWYNVFFFNFQFDVEVAMSFLALSSKALLNFCAVVVKNKPSLLEYGSASKESRRT